MPELKIYGTLWSVDVVHGGISVGLLGEGSTALVLRHICLRKSSTSRAWGAELPKQVGQPVLLLCCLLKSVYAEM